MHTECPSCKKQHSISVEKLRLSEGEFTCNRCYSKFDPVEHLSERGFFGLYQKNSSAKQNDTGLSQFWTRGIIISFLIFAFQIYWFKGDALVQNKSVRPWLNSVCSVIGCSLAPYKNSEELSVLNVSFNPANKNAYVLKAQLSNKANFPQHQPAVRLILKDFVGRVFAERIFHSQEYAKNAPTQIKPDMSTEIKLTIATPSKKIGGYHFELI